MSDISPSDHPTSGPTHIRPFARNERSSISFLPPTTLTSFVGRAREIETISALLRRPDVRLLTLTGTGGVGKTRLALQAATGLTDDFTHGVAFVPLASIRDPDLVVASVVQALDVPTVPNEPPLTRLQTFLANRNLLLVIDNFEHVLIAGSRVASLLLTCPHLKILCTSRIRLSVSGEHVFTVLPLPITSSRDSVSDLNPLGIDAVRLFIDRAAAVSSGFACTPQNVQAVSEICRRLDGLPLAIELAAARVSVLPLPALLDRLKLRLNLLTDGPRDAPAHQRTIRDSIAWSHDLLDSYEQRLFRRLAVFDGGCSLEAAAVVWTVSNVASGDVFDGIASLVRHSLLQKGGPDPTPRHFMLEAVREHALERLVASGEEDEVRRCHAAYLLALSESRGFEISEREWLERMEPEHDNVRAVLTWAIANGDIDTAQRLVAAMWLHFWAFREQAREGRRWAERVRDLGPGSATDAYQEVLFAESVFAASSGDVEHAIAVAHDALARARSNGSKSGIGMALHYLALATSMRDGLDEVQPMIEEALALLGDETGFRERRVAMALTHNLAVTVAQQGDKERAETLEAEALAGWHELGSDLGTVGSLLTLSDIAWEKGDTVQGASLGKQALSLSWNVGGMALLVEALRMAVGTSPIDCGHARLMARLWAAADRITEELGFVVPDTEREYNEGCLARVRAALGPDAFATEWSTGRTRHLDLLVAEALAYVPPSLPDDRNKLEACVPHHDLTPRELEILHHLAEHQTDQEIADQLFLSRRTVNAHVAHVLAKLDARTRRAAVSRARELAILP